MHYPRFALKIFEGRGPQVELTAKRTLGHLLEALTLINVYYLQRHPETPPLYDSGVTYWDPPSDGTDDDWQDIATTLQEGKGDCEDLACWRAAELRTRFGVPAYAVARVELNPVLTHKLNRDFYNCHIVVEYNGKIEDPSKILGMR